MRAKAFYLSNSLRRDQSQRKPRKRHGNLNRGVLARHFLLMALCLAFTSCVTKKEAERRAQAAFNAGQVEGLARAQALQGSNVTIQGPVKVRSLPWKEGLTVAQALVDAGYEGQREPQMILVIRAGRAIPFPVAKLLQGEDFPLQAGDIVEIRP